MVSALDSRLCGPGSSHGRGDCDVFLGESITTLCIILPLSIQEYVWFQKISILCMLLFIGGRLKYIIMYKIILACIFFNF